MTMETPQTRTQWRRASQTIPKSLKTTKHPLRKEQRIWITWGNRWRKRRSRRVRKARK